MPITPEDRQRQQDSLAALLGGQSQSGLYGRTSDLLAEDTDQFGNFDPRGGQAYTAATELDAQDDPWAQHYRDVGEAQSQEALYNLPGEQQKRDDALMRILAPIREKGRFDVEQQRLQAEGQMGAAQATARGRQATQEGSMVRTQASQAGQMQRQRNQALEAQAKDAQKTGEGTYNPLRWLMGRPTGEEQAATLRGQQQFDDEAPAQAGQSPNLAQELFGEFQEATPEQVAAYAQSELGLSDPAEIQELIAQYQALQGQ